MSLKTVKHKTNLTLSPSLSENRYSRQTAHIPRLHHHHLSEVLQSGNYTAGQKFDILIFTYYCASSYHV